MKRYFTDKIAAFTLDGIRCVQRTDGYHQGFSLQVTYKGNNFSINYPTQDERDFAFSEICKNLEERNKK